MSTFKQIGLAVGILTVIIFLTYTALQEGGFTALWQRVTTPPEASPVVTAEVSVTPTQAAISPVASATPVRSAVPSAMPTSAPMNGQAIAAILQAVNAQRAKVGSPPLVADPVLQALAQTHASDMVAHDYFSHTNFAGVTFQQRIESSAYTGTTTAENLGLTSGPAVEIVDGWMSSDGHRTNLLNSAYGEVGIGVATGTWQGFSAVFAVAVFGNEK